MDNYLFYNHYKYIFKKDGRDAICVNKEDQFVCRKPEELTYHGRDENGETINITIPLENTKV